MIKLSVQFSEFKEKLEKQLKFDEIERQYPSNLNSLLVGRYTNSFTTEVKGDNSNLRK